MALNIGELVGFLRLDDGEFDRGVDSAQHKLGRLGGVVHSAIGAVTSAVKYGAVALGGLGVAGGIAGLRTAAGMENARIAFTTMLGSAQKADAFLKQLANFAAKTPFEFPELQTAASSLISAGIQASKVIPIMTSLGNATSGMGTGAEGVERATVALQQMNAAGRITGEDLNQLRDAGIPVYDLLASATGKSKAEVVKLAQAGKLGKKELEQMMDALASGKGLERFNGLMDKQSSSLGGIFSTLKDTVNMTLAGLVTPALPAIKSGLGWVSGFITNTAAPAITGAFEGISHTFGQLLQGFRQGGMTDAVANLDAMTGAGGRLSTVFGAVSGFVTGTLMPAFDAVSSFVTGSLIPSIQNMADAIAPALLGAFTTIVNDGFHAAQEALAVLGPAITGVTGFLADHETATKVLAGAIVALIVVTKAHAAVLAVEAAGGLVSFLMHMKLVTAFTKAWTAAQWLLNVALDANPVGLVVIAIAALVAGLIYAYKHSETFRTIVKGAFDAVAEAVGWVIDKLGTAFGLLGHVPGFGWAKDAADALHHAADAAHRVGEEIKAIPKNVQVAITTTRLENAADDADRRRAVSGGRAVGGHPVPRGATGAIVTRPTLAWIGELGAEAVVPLNRTPGSRPLPVAAHDNTDNRYMRVHPDDLRALRTGTRDVHIHSTAGPDSKALLDDAVFAARIGRL